MEHFIYLNLQLKKIEFESKAVGTPGAWIPIGPTMGLSQGLLATSHLLPLLL